jgi:hypothetical protein
LHPVFAIDEPMHPSPRGSKAPDSRTAALKTESAKTSIERCFHTASGETAGSRKKRRPRKKESDGRPSGKETTLVKWL